MAKKRVRNKDMIFRNSIFGIIFTIINFIIICVLYYYVLNNNEYTEYLNKGITIDQLNMVINKENILTTLILATLVTPTFYILRGLLLGMYHFITRKDTFIAVVFNTSFNFVLLTIESGILILLLLLYHYILNHFIG